MSATPTVFHAQGQVAPTAPGGRPVRWAATARRGGISAPPFDSLNLAGYVGDDPAAVAENRGRVATGLGADDDAICIMDSVHGADIAEVRQGGVVPGVDALITDAPGLVLVALGADCVPIALVGADGRWVCAVHCGWRGLVADVVGVGVEAIRARGTDVRLAVLGPAVCGQCYPVPPTRAHEVWAACSPSVSSSALRTTADGQPGIDVREGVRSRLIELGLAPESVVMAGGCTVEDPDLFSYRRDGVTGRHGMAVVLGPADHNG